VLRIPAGNAAGHNRTDILLLRHTVTVCRANTICAVLYTEMVCKNEFNLNSIKTVRGIFKKFSISVVGAYVKVIISGVIISISIMY
jgi:hypothetical protein